MTDTRIRKRWLGCSFMSFVVAYVGLGAVMWTDRLSGLIANLFMIPLAGLMWLMLIFPLHLLMHRLTRSCASLGLRRAAFFAPLIVLLMLVSLSWDMSVGTRFAKLAKAPFPRSAGDLKAHFSGGGFADHSDTFYFKCSRVETLALIEAIEASPTSGMSHTYETPPRSTFGMTLEPEGWPKGWPNPSLWSGLKAYKQDDGRWFRTILTNQSYTQVYVFVHSI